MIRRRRAPSSVLLVALLAPASRATAQDDPAKDARRPEAPGSTLEKLFPEAGLFGPEATGMAFSADGMHAAWLYRPLRERRHGGDLWLYDVARDQLTRLTSVAVMAEYHAAARKVKRDRIECARKLMAKEKAAEP